MDTSFQYSEYVGLMYQKGYYVEQYSINLLSRETNNIKGRIFIVPDILDGDDIIYVFTGTSQKLRMLSESTEFRMTLFDTDNREFKDEDLIMLSKINRTDDRNIITNLFTRNYATWRFGIKFERGISLDSNRYLMFQAQKSIGKFDIDIINIDLFRHKNKIERKDDRMLWLD